MDEKKKKERKKERRRKIGKQKEKGMRNRRMEEGKEAGPTWPGVGTTEERASLRAY